MEEEKNKKSVIVEGKKYILINESRREIIWMVIKTIFLILLVITIVALISAIATIVKHKDMLSNEPLTYVMERYNLESCSCIDDEGEVWNSGEKGFIPKYKGNELVITYKNESAGGKLK